MMAAVMAAFPIAELRVKSRQLLVQAQGLGVQAKRMKKTG